MTAAVFDSTRTADVLRGADPLDGLAADWAALQPATLPTFSHDWFASAARTLHQTDSLAVVVSRRAGAITAIAPLASAAQWVGRLEIIGSGTLHEPAGLVYRDTAALESLCAELIALRRPLVLPRIEAGGPLALAFASAARGRGRLFDLAAAATPFVRIGPDFDFKKYCETLSARRRQDYRRARRQLEAQGRVNLDIRHSTATTWRSELHEAMRVESAGWKSRRGTALLRQESMRGFFEALCERLARRGVLRVCFLRLNGEPIAMQICVEEAQRWSVLKIGYDERFAAQSPGIQLMWDLLEHAFERRAQSFEMLGTAEPWLRIWTSDQRAWRTLVFYPHNLHGVAALGADAMRSLFGRLRSLFRRDSTCAA